MESDKIWVAFHRRLKRHFSVPEMSHILSAYEFAKKKHEKTKPRKNGRPYITHPVAVANILLSWKIFDVEIILIALLHDTIEESENQTITFFEIVSKFGYGIGVQILSLTKSELPLLRALYLIGLRFYGTWRSLLTKFADTLHNFRTMKKMSLEQQKKRVQSFDEHFDHFHEKIKFFANMGVFDNSKIKKEELLRSANLAYGQILKERDKYSHLAG